MKRLALKVVLAWCAGLSMTAAAEQASTTRPGGWGTHGMAVFGGRETLYASHLPMFHAPHDTQVILRFRLRDAGVDAALRNALASKPELWTLAPEPFDLHRLRPGHSEPLREFPARFVQGHFERGGSERYVDQTLIVDEIILFRPLSPEQNAHSKGRYLLLGKGREHFLIKEIDRRPDFDLIIALQPLQQAVSPIAKIVQLPSETLYSPSIRSLNAALRTQAGKRFKYASTIYFETADLR